MIQLTAEKANKLLKEIQDKEKFDTKLKKAIDEAEIIIDDILCIIETAIHREKVDYIIRDLTDVNKLCSIEVIRKLNKLGYVLTRPSQYRIDNKLTIKISWGKEKYNKEEFDDLNILAHVFFKNWCKYHNQDFQPYFMFRETN